MQPGQGFFKTFFGYILIGLTINLLRSPLFMLIFGFFSGVFFFHFMPEHAEPIVQSVMDIPKEIANLIFPQNEIVSTGSKTTQNL